MGRTVIFMDQGLVYSKVKKFDFERELKNATSFVISKGNNHEKYRICILIRSTWKCNQVFNPTLTWAPNSTISLSEGPVRIFREKWIKYENRDFLRDWDQQFYQICDPIPSSRLGHRNLNLGPSNEPIWLRQKIEPRIRIGIFESLSTKISSNIFDPTST